MQIDILAEEGTPRDRESIELGSVADYQLVGRHLEGRAHFVVAYGVGQDSVPMRIRAQIKLDKFVETYTILGSGRSIATIDSIVEARDRTLRKHRKAHRHISNA